MQRKTQPLSGLQYQTEISDFSKFGFYPEKSKKNIKHVNHMLDRNNIF